MEMHMWQCISKPPPHPEKNIDIESTSDAIQILES